MPGRELSLTRLISSLMGQHKLLVLRFVVSSVGRAATSMAVIFFIREFLAAAVHEDTAFVNLVSSWVGPSAVLWTMAGLLLSTYSLGAVFLYDNQIVVQHLIKVIELGVMERLIKHLLRLSVPYSDMKRSGEVIQTLRTDVTQLRMVVHAAANMALEALIVIGLLGMAASISLSLATWVIVVLPVISLPVFLVSSRLRRKSYDVRRTGYLLFDMVLEILQGMRVIKTFRGEEMQTRMSIRKGEDYFNEVIQMIRLQAMGRVGMESLAGLSVVIVVLVGGLQVTRGQISWPSLLAFIMAIRVMHTPLHLIHKQYVEIQTWHASVWRIMDFLKVKPQIQESDNAKSLASPPETIACEELGFGYGATHVLESISFQVEAGETIGIVGPSGAGKSTLLNLLVRLYDPTSGRILFNGQDLRDFRLDDIYDKVSIVAQEPFLFSATARENIRCGRPSATNAEVEEAARAACIHDEVMSMSLGYETAIGIGGRELSRGQAQRVNVARAFLKNAPILLLDEATSSLDSVAESEVQVALDRLLESRTSFVVAHRLTTLRNADRLLVLEQGQLIGIGTHAELLRDCDLYRRLWNSQQLVTQET